MKLSTIKTIKKAFAERNDVVVEVIKTNAKINTITAYRNQDEVVFVKENYNGGAYTTFDLTDIDVQQKLEEYSKLNNFKQPYVL